MKLVGLFAVILTLLGVVATLLPARATSPARCWTSHGYDLELVTVTHDDIVVPDLSEYEGFKVTLETMPDYFSLYVENPALRGWMSEFYRYDSTSTGW